MAKSEGDLLVSILPDVTTSWKLLKPEVMKKRLLAMLFLVSNGLIVALLSSCGQNLVNKQEEEPTEVLDRSIREKLATYSKEKSEVPLHDALLTIVQETPGLDSKPAADFLFGETANQSLAVDCVRRCSEDFQERSPALREEFLTQLVENYADYESGAYATDLSLSSLEVGNADAFIERCEKLRIEKLHSAVGRIAVYRLMGHYDSTYERGKAAYFGLLLAVNHAEHCTGNAMGNRIVGVLNRAGMELEAGIFEKYGISEQIAQTILEEFEESLLAQSTTVLEASGGLRGFYLHLNDNESTPTEWRKAIEELESVERAKWWARFTYLMRHSERAEILQGMKYYAESLEPGLSDESVKIDRLFFTGASKMLLIAQAQAQKSSEPPVGRAVEQGIERGRVPSEVEISTRIGLQLIQLEHLDAKSIGTLALGNDFSEYSRFCKEMTGLGLPGVAEVTLVGAIGAIGDREATLPLRLELADLYEKQLESPRQAAKVLLTLYSTFPSHKSSVAAKLRAVVILIDTDLVEDAYVELLEIQGRVDLSPDQAATAQFLMCICESLQGNLKDAEEGMASLLDTYPTSMVAPRTLMWLATQDMQESDYVSAQIYLQDLVERFPESNEAERARPILAKLESLNSKKGSG